MNRSLKAWMVCVLACSMVTSVCLAADKPVVTIEIQSVNKLVTDINCITAGLELPNQTSNLVSGISGLLKTPKLAGIDTNSPVRIYVYLPELASGSHSSSPSRLWWNKVDRRCLKTRNRQTKITKLPIRQQKKKKKKKKNNFHQAKTYDSMIWTFCAKLYSFYLKENYIEPCF